MKKLFGIFVSVMFIFSAMVIGVSAYWSPNGNREILYYNFNIETDSLCGCSSSFMKRLYNREWVVTVSSRANNSYGITYGMLDNDATSWSNALVSYTTTKQGTGDFGSTYYSNDTVGWNLYLGALINTRDLNKGVSTNGQWSTDAQY